MIDKVKEIFRQISTLFRGIDKTRKQRDAALALIEGHLSVNIELSKKITELRAQLAEARNYNTFDRQYGEYIEGEAFNAMEGYIQEKARAGRLEEALMQIEHIEADRFPDTSTWKDLASGAIDIARKALAHEADEQPADSDAGIVWPKNEVRHVKAKLGETRVRPSFVISDDDEQPAAAIVRWHKYTDRGEGIEDADPHSDERVDYERYQIDEMLEEIARRIETDWVIPEMRHAEQPEAGEEREVKDE